MCGIAGYIGFNPNNNSILQAMTDAIIHRGPDGEGHYHADDFAFGHRRLAIVDLTEAGKQPMHYKERYTITYNGEVYNYIELKAELQSVGYNFNNDSDTEVILASYDYWGVDCLNKFNGDWAFVLYDSATNQFFIARDRFGIKPLYYYQDSEKFIFSSEIKGIYASGLVKKAPNEEYLKRYLDKGPNEYDAPTAFENIWRFPFAHYFLGTKEQLLNNPQFTRFWQLQVNESNERFDAQKAKQYAQQYYDLLNDAVRLRLRADVKVGAALSGGLDSSSIVYLINEKLKAQGKQELLETFSSVYKSDGTQHCDESEYIDLLAKELNVHSNQIEPQEKDIPAEHEKMIWAMENPPESTLMSSWHTFKKVKLEAMNVNLDGQGADEQLAGYTPYISSYFVSISLADLYKEVFNFLKLPDVRKRVIQSFLLAHVKLLLGQSIYEKLFRKIKGHKAPKPLNITLADAFTKGLVTLLHYADHTSMGHSVESRAPFMDFRLVEFLFTVPACYKMHNGWSKYIARLAFDKKLPDEINWRKDKMGWPVPESKWLDGGLNSWMVSTISSSKLLNRLNVKYKGKNNINGKLDLRLLNIAVFELHFFND